MQAPEVNVAGRADKASSAALGIEDSSISVHWGLGSGTSGNEVRLSQSGGDGRLQMAELNSVVSADEAIGWRQRLLLHRLLCWRQQ